MAKIAMSKLSGNYPPPPIACAGLRDGVATVATAFYNPMVIPMVRLYVNKSESSSTAVVMDMHPFGTLGFIVLRW